MPDTKIRYKNNFHLIGAFSVQTVAEAELTPDVENSSLEQVSQLQFYVFLLSRVDKSAHMFIDLYVIVIFLCLNCDVEH
jgi:hypothetical protein